LATATAAGGAATVQTRAHDARGDGCGVVTVERAGPGAEATAGIRGSDAAAADPDLGSDERALGVRVGADRAGEVLGLERGEIHDVAQIGELVLDLVQLLLRLAARP